MKFILLILLFFSVNSFADNTARPSSNNKIGHSKQSAETKQNSFFYCSNSVEKTPTKPGENYKNVKTIKFSEYPFFNNEILFFETCKFNSLVSDVPCYLRLEKIKK